MWKFARPPDVYQVAYVLSFQEGGGNISMSAACIFLFFFHNLLLSRPLRSNIRLAGPIGIYSRDGHGMF